MYRDRTVTGRSATQRRVFWAATALATVLQLAMVLVGLSVASLREANLFPIAGTLIAVLAGFLFSRRLPGLPLSPALVGGALAGAICSLLGAVVAALTRLAGPSVLVILLIASLTGAVAGAVGGFFGTLFRVSHHRHHPSHHR